MKKSTISITRIFIMLSFISSSILMAQPNCQWAKGYGGAANEAGNGIAVDAQGNVYTIGNFNSPTITFGTAPALTNIDNSGGSSDVYIMKSDSCGNVLWAKHLGDEAYDDRGMAIAVDKAGNVYVTGSFYSYNITIGTSTLHNDGSGLAVYVAKYTSAGNPVWAKLMDPTGTAISSGISVDKNNNVYVSGYYASDSVYADGIYLIGNGSDYNSFLAKYDVNGTIQWAKSAGAGSNQSFGVAVDTTSGNIVVAGSYQDSIRIGTIVLPGQSNLDVYIAKYNQTTGAVIWAKYAAGDYDDQASGIATDKNGNIYITGYFGSDSISFGTNKLLLPSNFTYANGFLAKYNSSGTAVWAKRIGGLTDDYGQAVATNKAGDVFVGGNYYSTSISLGSITLNNVTTSDTTSDVFLAKYDTNGNIKWAKSAGGIRNDYVEHIALGANGIPNIVGEYASATITFGQTTLTNTNSGSDDIFITNDITRNGTTTPHLCEVTVDTLSQHNIVFWDKTPYTNVKNFILYREIATNNYQPIATIPYDSLSEFVDTVHYKYFPNTGDPNVGAYRYKIQLQDSSGNYSLLSPYHNTIYIGYNNAGLFSFNQPYVIEGAPNPVNTYVLMHAVNGSNVWTSGGSVAGTQTSISDASYSNFDKWYVETTWNTPFSCTPTRSSINTTRSNIKSAASTNNGIADNSLNNVVKVFPNPSSEKITIEYPVGYKKYELQIIDVLGQLIYNEQLTADGASNGIITKQMDVSNFNKGIYTLIIETNTNKLIKKLVIN